MFGRYILRDVLGRNFFRQRLFNQFHFYHGKPLFALNGNGNVETIYTDSDSKGRKHRTVNTVNLGR